MLKKYSFFQQVTSGAKILYFQERSLRKAVMDSGRRTERMVKWGLVNWGMVNWRLVNWGLGNLGMVNWGMIIS